MASFTWGDYGTTSPTQSHEGKERRVKNPQTRQLLSCTECRKRKVKCDRIKPCSACCARGTSNGCEFVVGEGNDYSPIQQSYEIRRLRQENQRLKERLQALRQLPSDEEDGNEPALDHRHTKGGTRSFIPSQRRFKTGDRIDNLYFGSPGLASIVSEFASLSTGNHSLTHNVPKARELYSSDAPAYPFPAIQNCSTSDALLELLPSREELLQCLNSLHGRALPCFLPQLPEEIMKEEIERFLEDPSVNAEKAPDMLALIFATLAISVQINQYDEEGGGWNIARSEAALRQGNAFLAASMQSLRNASFMNTPSLLGIQTLIMMGAFLANSSRFLDAWTLFGTTIRLAHSIGLHRNPKYLDPVPSLSECSVRQTLWWWMLNMDQQFSITLGRPLGISGFGDCPPPQQLTTNPTMLRLSDFTYYFTILARQILSSDGMMVTSKIDELTDSLLDLWDTMPSALHFDESWTDQTTPLPEWPLEAIAATLFVNVQSLLILLNRQYDNATQRSAQTGGSSPIGKQTTYRPRSSLFRTSANVYSNSSDLLQPSSLRGRALVMESSIAILKAFVFFKHRHPSVLICWSLSQQAFNACAILLIDAWETENSQHEWLVEQAFGIFRELEMNKVHSLAGLAVARISKALLKLGQHRDGTLQDCSMSGQPVQEPTSSPTNDWSNDTVMGNTGMFLLEGSVVQHPVAHNFQALDWNMTTPFTQHYSPKQPVTCIPTAPVPVSRAVSTAVPAATVPFVPSPTTISTHDPQFNFMPQSTFQQTPRRFQHNHSAWSPYSVPTLGIDTSVAVRSYAQPYGIIGTPYEPRGTYRAVRTARALQRRH